MQVIRTVLLPVVAVIVISVVVYLYWQPLPTTKNQYPRPNSYTEFGQQSAHGHSANQSPIIVSEAERTTLKAKIQNASLSSNTETVTMLMWTGLFTKGPWIGKTHTENCYGHRCLFTSDKSFFSDSDIIVIHGRAPGVKDSVNQALKLKRPPHQRWVMLDKESPANTPDLGFLNGHINWTVNFMADADIPARYGNVLPGTFQGGFDPGKNYLEKKTGMAAIMVSNCVPARMKWVTTMQQYIDVKVYGACGPLKCNRENMEECLAELRKYKFYLAFENSFCKDYTTLKFYRNALQNGIIPIMISGVNTSDVTYVPPGSFINALDFPTVKDLVDHMKKVGSSPELYNEYFRWHSNYTLYTEGFSNTLLCKVCKKAHLDPFSEKSHSNISWWYSFKKNCKTYPAPVPR